MQVVLCALAKNEHLYINDFVKWYVNLGFDKLYIYDNDDNDKPRIKDFIEPKYLEKVEIIDIRGMRKNRLQHQTYTMFYNTHKFDWCLFCDIDEFLFGVNNIKDFLSKPIYRNAEQIRIKWKLFGDDDLIERDMSKPVYEIFHNEIKSSLNKNLIDKGTLEIQGKSIVKGGLKNVVIQSPHFASFLMRNHILKSVLPSGKLCFSKVVIMEDYSNETVYLHHYMTKSLSEFINQKINRTDAVFGDYIISMDYYWRINKKTDEKLKYIQEKLGT